MKKTLIAMAAVAVAGAASAQVTITGAFGAAYQSYTQGAKAATGLYNSDATKLGAPAVAAGTYRGYSITDSSIKFSASEDLGGGMSFAAATSLSANNLRGGNVTKEDTSISLAGGFGSITVANTRSSNSAIKGLVFASSMPVTSFYAGVESRSAIDALAYTTPELIPGLKAAVTSVEGAEGNGTSTVKTTVVDFMYSGSGITAGATIKSNSGLAATEKTNNTELYATYDAGIATFGLGSGAAEKVDGSDGKLTTFGISIPMGAVTAGANYAKRGDKKMTEAGFSYAMSKRTTLNVMTGKLTGGDNEGSQYRVGLVNTF
jgi:hypothetical protein